MKTYITSILTALTLGLTLTSCGGGGGGGGGAGHAADVTDENSEIATENAETGGETDTTNEKDYAPESKSSIGTISFGPYTITSDTVKASHLSSVYLGYSYKKIGKNKAEISIYGKKTQDFQASATLVNGRFYIQNYPNVTVFEVDSTFTITYISDNKITVEGYEDTTSYSYTTRLLNLIKLSENDNRKTYNTTGIWR